MADLALTQDPQTLLWDFAVQDGDIVRTNDPWPAVLRLLSQGSWIGDNGERAGECLNDVTLNTTGTRDRINRIVQTRLAALLRTGEITAVNVQEIRVIQDRAVVFVQITIPGQQPRVVQVPLTL